MSTHKLYVWRRKFAGLEVCQVGELKRLQMEIARLKKLIADQHLSLDVAKEALAKKS